jgi:hypothetical protein
MPLLDHFHPPLHPQHHWESFHSNWATRIADALNERWLPPEFLAEEYTHAGSRLEIDVATYQEEPRPATGNGPSAGSLGTATWTPPAPARTLPSVFPDTFEVRVFATAAGMTLVGAIEIVSPANKDRPETRQAFAAKCANYLYQGIGLIIVDIVTNRTANLHNETMRLMGAGAAFEVPGDWQLYTVAYRPVQRGERAEIDLWHTACGVGARLPTMPLRLTGDFFVPVDFEATYDEACRRRRLL